jgi:hypothetical protein
MYDRSGADDHLPPPDPLAGWPGRGISPTLIGVALFTTLTLIFLIWVFGLFPGNTCKTIDECVAKADQMASAGKFDPALHSLESAIQMAQNEPHAPYAYLWCRRGDILLLVDSVEQAVTDFETCIEWSGDDPGLLTLREHANLQLQQLH